MLGSGGVDGGWVGTARLGEKRFDPVNPVPACYNLDMRDEPPKIEYLNTDLVLTAARDLRVLTNELAAGGLCVLAVQEGGNGLWYSTLETSDCIGDREPENTIRELLDAIEGINGDAQELWQECSQREFNIGYDCGDEPWAFNNGLSNSTLERTARVGATLRITIYPHRPPVTQ